MEIIFGIPLLIAGMVSVMGAPFAYYLKRDLAYEATKGKNDKIRLEAWYG